MFSLFFDLCFTAFIYLFIPFILIYIGKPLSIIKLRIIIVFNMCIGIFIMSIITGKAGADGGSVLWTLVGYNMMKKRLVLPDYPPESLTQVKETPMQIKKTRTPLLNNYKQPSPETLTHSNKTNKRSLNFLYPIIVLLTIIVFTLSIAFYNQKQTIANQKQYISALEEKTNNLINLVEDYKSLTFKYYTTLNSTEDWALKIYNDQLTFLEKRILSLEGEKIFSNDLNTIRLELMKKAKEYTN